MALNDRKIVVYENPITSLPDHPSQGGWTAAALKAAFDANATGEIKSSINGIVDDLSATTEESSGADQIGSTAIKVDGAITVQGQLKELQSDKMNLAGVETITGIKTFNVSPIVPTPTANTHPATKKYVDDKASAVEIAEQERVIVENQRVIDENARKSNETTRLSNETIRLSNETTRISNENIRITAENLRESNETARVEADILRGQTVEAIEENYAPRLVSAEAEIIDLNSEKLSTTHNTDEIAHTDIRESINNLGAYAVASGTNTYTATITGYTLVTGQTVN